MDVWLALTERENNTALAELSALEQVGLVIKNLG